MPINTSCLETNLQTQIDGFTCATAPEDLLFTANSAKNLTTDVESYVALGCELPDLNEGKTPVGSMFYVDELGVPVVAGSQSWLGLDGRTYRKDIPDTELYSWGCNCSAVLSIGSISVIGFSSPVREFNSVTTWQSISAGVGHQHAVKIDGTLWGAGRNGFGNLGIGNTTSCYTSFVQEISSSTNWSISNADADQSHAIKTDGTLWGWGGNSYGVLGVGNAIAYSSPVQEISSSSNWCAVSGTRNGTVALKTDSTLWGWGYDQYGHIGDCDSTLKSSPVQEAYSETNWSKIAGGLEYTLAIKTSGELWATGNGSCGRLGYDCINTKYSFVQEITSSSNWYSISAGFCTSTGIKSDGTLWAWGANNFGQVGDSSLVNASSPVQEISSSTSWCSSSRDYNIALAIKTDGTLWGWGCNLGGALGDGTNICASSPVQEITSSTNWSSSSNSYYASHALKLVV